MKRFQPIEVFWVDSHIVDGWCNVKIREENTKELGLLCKTVGMLIKKNKKRIIITQSVSITKDGDVDNISDTIIIPMCAVKKINKL